jgi:Polyketide cyclase / dehydrase and lipid transport
MFIIYILLGLILALLLAAFLMPKVYHVEKSVIISKSSSAVMDKIADLNYYSKWNPWQQSDPGAASTITGTPATAGHKYAWVGKKIGVGSLTLTSLDDKHIHFDLEFLKPWKAKAKDNWLFEKWGDGNETKVTWQNSGELPWPMARLMGPMITKNLNHQFASGLENLKKMCEGVIG